MKILLLSITSIIQNCYEMHQSNILLNCWLRVLLTGGGGVGDVNTDGVESSGTTADRQSAYEQYKLHTFESSRYKISAIAMGSLVPSLQRKNNNKDVFSSCA